MANDNTAFITWVAINNQTFKDLQYSHGNPYLAPPWFSLYNDQPPAPAVDPDPLIDTEVE